MVDDAVSALEQHFAQLTGAGSSQDVPSAPDWFDEAAYLRLNADVAAAVAQGRMASGYQHYRLRGWYEKRPLAIPSAEQMDRLVRLIPLGAENDFVGAGQQATTACHVEAVQYSKAGGLTIIGWVNDTSNPLHSIRFVATKWIYIFSASGMSRIRRRDVEAAVGTSASYSYGFFAFVFLESDLEITETPTIVFEFADGSVSETKFAVNQVDDVELRNLVIAYLAQSEFFGNHQLEGIRLLGGGIGKNIIAHNKNITAKILAGACAQYFGAPKKPLRGSIVICLYGRPEYFFLQHTLFSRREGFSDYELIYVSNSPELAERLMAEARAAQIIYDVPVILVLLPGNAGFGAANNVAATYARSDRIMIVNPDVFPKDLDWAKRHTEALDQLPAEQTRLFGVPLYYDDGTLMHGGMYFELDTGISMRHGEMVPQQLARVEHYGKGAPVDALQFIRSRPIPAVTGAFISVERAWFETLNGFTEDFVFGHYEDADLCLKSFCAGSVPWIHDIRLWHLEGKGSTRLPVHEGGSLVNRWIFTERWIDVIKDGLEGPQPTHPLLQTNESVASDATQQLEWSRS